MTETRESKGCNPFRTLFNQNSEEHHEYEKKMYGRGLGFGHTTPAVLAFKAQCVVKVGFAS